MDIIHGPVFERKGVTFDDGLCFVESLRRLQEIAIDLDVSHLPKRVQDGSRSQVDLFNAPNDKLVVRSH
jgi:hypothetical protein